MTRDSDHDSGSDRRTFLQSLAAAGGIGAIGARIGAGDAAASTAAADSYHETLSNQLQNEEGFPEGEFVYATTEQDALDTFSLQGGDNGTETEIDVTADDVPITLADRVEITENPENAYSYTYTADIEDRSFSEGDALLAVAYLRDGDTAGEETSAETQAGFKWRYTNPDGGTGYSSNMVTSSANVSPGSNWERHYFVVEVDSKPDGSNFQPYLEFWTGFREQTIDFGGIALVDYSDTDVTADQLSQALVSYDYEGRAEDAQWRTDAEERIERVRKTDFEVDVVGPDGEPVENASVDVAMQEHEFDFGGEFTLSQIGDRWDSDVAETYRQKHLENFNKAALTNALKVSPWSGEWGDAVNQETAKRAVQWLLDEDVPIRGHALVWEEYDWMNVDPESSAEEINELVKERIRARAAEFQGDFPEWDLHNHPIWQSNIRDDIGQDAALEWWATGHDAAPDAQMYVNEMNIVAGSSYRDPYDEFISWLMENDAGVEGIGFMGHFDITALTPPEELLSVFDRFGEHGVPLQITEFDVQMDSRDDENKVSAQADYVRDVLTAAFSHEAVEGVMSWCFWDENGDPRRYYGPDWTLRPHGEEYRRLVFEEWWTEETGETDADGVFSGRGFEGTYEVVAREGQRIGVETVEFTDDGASVTVQIAPASVGGIDLDVDQHTLVGDDTVDIGVTLTSEDGLDLPIPEGAASFESTDEEVLTVDEEGVVSVVGDGTATASVTVSAYDDTAAASARFAARENADLGEPTLSDDASDLSLVDSDQNVFAAGYDSRHDDGSFFQRSDGGQPGSVTYRVSDGVGAFEVDAYVNNNATDSDVQFAVSNDGESFEPMDVAPTVVEEPSGSNGYYAFWRYSQVGSLPDDASYLRITIPEGPEGYAVVVGAVDIWSETVSLDADDPTGPAAVVDGLVDGRDYARSVAPAVSVGDDESEVTDESVTLDSESWSGDTVTERGEHTLTVEATNAPGVTTEAGIDFTVTDPTSIELVDTRGQRGPTGFEATLTVTDTGDPLADRELVFSADGETVHTGATDEDGTAFVKRGEVFDQASPQGGSLELTVSFHAGDDPYLRASEVTEEFDAGNGNGGGN